MKMRFAETVAKAKMAKINVLMIPSIPGWTFFSQTLSLKQETFAIGTGPILISLILFDKRTLSSVQNIRLHLNLLSVTVCMVKLTKGLCILIQILSTEELFPQCSATDSIPGQPSDLGQESKSVATK